MKISCIDEGMVLGDDDSNHSLPFIESDEIYENELHRFKNGSI